MKTLLRDVNVLWTPDLTVGSVSLDERNRAMFGRLAAAEETIGSATPSGLSGWLRATLDQLELLLQAEERELDAIGYPELDFHRRLHGRARTRIQSCRIQLDKAEDPAVLAQLTRDICAELAVWLMRHMQDADKLFFPYIDTRYRDA